MMSEQREIGKIQKNNEIIDEEITFSQKPSQPNKIHWNMFDNELSANFNVNGSESEFVGSNFKKESFDDKNDDHLFLKVTCKRIKAFVHFSKAMDLQKAEIDLSCSDGINFFRIW